jgi:hypothetical protein
MLKARSPTAFTSLLSASKTMYDGWDNRMRLASLTSVFVFPRSMAKLLFLKMLKLIRFIEGLLSVEEVGEAPINFRPFTKK